MEVNETQIKRMVEILMNYAGIDRSKARYIVGIIIDDLATTNKGER